MNRCRFFLIFLGMLFMVSRVEATGGDVLERIIQLPRAKGTIYSLLGKVSEQSGYLFIYDSKVINNDSVVRIKKQKCTVRQAIYEITGDSNLKLEVLGNHILIARTAMNRPVLKKEMAAVSAPEYLTITGKLLDKETGEPVANASVIVHGTSLGNITNQDGEFRLHLPDSLSHETLTFSHVGYIRQNIQARILQGRNNVLSLEPKVVPLQEVLIRLVEPKKLLQEMLEYRSQNYSSAPVYLTTFYREGVQLKDKFQSLTEAVFKVYKASSMEPLVSDQVKLLKMSKIDNREKTDSVIAKIRSGVEACLELDLVKKIPDFLQLESSSEFYTYTSGNVVFVDDRMANIVYFEQKHGVKDPLFCGELYIDSENHALLQARFEIQPKYIKKATRTFVLRQAHKTRLSPHKITYTVSYKPWNGTYYVHHIRGDLYFKIKKRHRLFSQPVVHTWFEMVTCRVDNHEVVRFPRAERLPTRAVFADTDFKYDDSFWEDFNVIPLEEELSKIIEKVSLKIEQTEKP